MTKLEHFIQEHMAVVLVSAFVLIVAIGAFFQSKKASNSIMQAAPSTDVTGAGAAGALGKLYEAFNSTTTIIENSNNSSTSTVNNPTVTGVPIPIRPVPPRPVPTPITPRPIPKPVYAGRRIWDVRYTVRRGDTLTGIAAGANATLHMQGSGNNGVTMDELYTHSKATIDADAQAHGYPISRDPRDNIFPGEIIILPRWFVGP